MTPEMKMLNRWYDECDVIIRSSHDQSEISRACKLQTQIVELMGNLSLREGEND